MWAAGLSLGLSIFGASANKRAAEASMRAQAEADTAGRIATARAKAAQVKSQNFQATMLQRNIDLMQIKSKADSTIRAEDFNNQMAIAVVKGAASGRTLGDGSMYAMFSKADEDLKWDQLWAENNLQVSEGAMYTDKENIYKAGYTSLMLGAEAMGVQRLAHQAGGNNMAANAQQAFNNTMVGVGQSILNNYGNSLFRFGSK